MIFFNLLGRQAKLDSFAVDGLLGVYNSLAYKVHEIERHLHSGARWFGAAVTPTATNKADHIGPSVDHFSVVSGDNAWGDWVQIFGSDDTPFQSGNAFFDPHLIQVTDTDDEGTFFLQFSRGASGDAGITAGTFTDIIFTADSANKVSTDPVIVQTGRAPVGSLLWARTLTPSQSTKTINFYIGIHEYEG